MDSSKRLMTMAVSSRPSSSMGQEPASPSCFAALFLTASVGASATTPGFERAHVAKTLASPSQGTMAGKTR